MSGNCTQPDTQHSRTKRRRLTQHFRLTVERGFKATAHRDANVRTSAEENLRIYGTMAALTTHRRETCSEAEGRSTTYRRNSRHRRIDSEQHPMPDIAERPRRTSLASMCRTLRNGRGRRNNDLPELVQEHDENELHDAFAPTWLTQSWPSWRTRSWPETVQWPQERGRGTLRGAPGALRSTWKA